MIVKRSKCMYLFMQSIVCACDSVLKVRQSFDPLTKEKKKETLKYTNKVTRDKNYL